MIEIGSFFLFIFFSGMVWLIINYIFQSEIIKNINIDIKKRDKTREIFIYFIVCLLIWNLLSIFIVPVVFLFPLLQKWYYERKRAKLVEKVELQLVDFLRFFSSSINAGTGLSLGMEASVNASVEPLKEMLLPVVKDVKNGIPLGSAWKEWADKIGSREAFLIGMTISIFQDSGGNITKIFESIADVLKKRIALREKIETITGMGKMQATVMILIGPFMVIAILFIAPEMLKYSFDNFISIVLLVTAIILEVIAVIIIKRMIKIDY